MALQSILFIDYASARWKILDLAYNRREVRDKRPLGRDPDRSWRYRHTIVNIYFRRLLPPMSKEPSAAIKKALH